MKKIKAEIGAPVLRLLLDILETLRHNDYEVARSIGFDIEYEDGVLQPSIESMINDFCKPLITADRDIEINCEYDNIKPIYINGHEVNHFDYNEGQEQLIAYGIENEYNTMYPVIATFEMSQEQWEEINYAVVDTWEELGKLFGDAE